MLSGAFSRLIWLVWMLVFGVLSCLFARQVYLAVTCKSWPVTNGVVFGFYEKPNYRYSVAGQTYQSDCVRILGTGGISESEKLAVRYPLNAKVTVHYYPGKPSVSALETKFDPLALLLLPMLGLMTLLGMAGLYFGWRWRAGQREPWPIGYS